MLSRGRDYSVKDLGGSPQGYTDLLRKELGVSLDATAGQTRWTQLHELAHVHYSLWSPERIKERVGRKTGRRLPTGAILAAEDARINELMTRAVRDAHDGFALTHGDQLRRDIEGYAASHASPAPFRDEIRKACDPGAVARVDAFCKRIKAMPTGDLTLLRVTVPLAELLADITEGKPEGGQESKPEPKPQPKPRDEDEDSEDESPTEDKGESEDESEGEGEGKPQPDESEDEDADKDEGEAEDEDGSGAGADEDGDEDDADDEDGEDEAPAAPSGDADPDDEATFGKPDATHTTCGHAPKPYGAGKVWMIPQVLEPALTRVLPGGNCRVQTVETGRAIRWTHAHRLQTDGMMFRRNRRKPGAMQRGTVLVDGSGSMQFTNDHLDALLDMLPYATVVVYSGDYWGGADLVIVARNGRRVADMADVKRHGGNGCDGPALLWLSRMPAPRLWISDGQVIGANGTGAQLDDECAAIMVAAGIVQVHGTWGEPHGTWGERYRVEHIRASRTMVKEAPPVIDERLKAVLLQIQRGLVPGA